MDKKKERKNLQITLKVMVNDCFNTQLSRNVNNLRASNPSQYGNIRYGRRIQTVTGYL